MKELEAYIKERDEILLKDDPVAFKQWAEGRGTVFRDQEQAEVTRHKCITAVTSFPEEFRAKSRKWLTDRNYQTLG